MDEQKGYVKLYRSTLRWEWFTEINTAHVWLYILMRANYEPTRFKGIKVGRGQMLESLSKIAKNTGLTVRNVRTAISHLKTTGEITYKATRYGMLINVVKYSVYQQSPADN